MSQVRNNKKPLCLKLDMQNLAKKQKVTELKVTKEKKFILYS